MSLSGHSRPMHSVPVPINVGCYSNSDIIVRRRSEVTLRTNKRQCLVRKAANLGRPSEFSINGDSDERERTHQRRRFESTSAGPFPMGPLSGWKAAHSLPSVSVKFE